MFGWVGDLAKSAFNSVKDLAGEVIDAGKAAVDWVGDLFSGDLGTQPVPVSEVVEKVRNGNSQEWHDGAGKATELADQHQSIGQEITRIMLDLEATWTGSGSDKAREKIKPFADVVNSAVITFTQNGTNINNMAHGFDGAKNSMVPMSTPPNKSFGDIINPFDADVENEIEKYNKLAEQNLAHYNAYAQQAQTNGQQLNIDYGQLKPFEGGDITLVDAPAPVGGKPGSGDYEQPAPVAVGQGPSQPASPGTYEYQAGNPVSGPYVQPGSGPVAAGTTIDDGTKTAGYVPPTTTNTPPHTGPPLTAGGMSVPPTGPNMPLVTGVGGPGGRLGGMPGTPGAPGSGGNAGGVPGKGTGAAPGGGVAGRPGTAGAPGTGAVGGRGTGMPMGGVPAGAGRGTRGEDTDHERKYGLADDTVFTLDENGTGPVDSQTGRPAVPPTIGA